MVLLDVNVLLALCDEAHEFHQPAWNWFETRGIDNWSTCPLTENGFVRIFGHPGHPNGPGTIFAAWSILDEMCGAEGHQFWPDAISLRDRKLFSNLEGISSRGLTDLYLLGLATHHHARFATFDRHILSASVEGGDAALEGIAV